MMTSDPGPAAGKGSRWILAARTIVVVLLVLQIPVFLCRTLTPDAVLYDLQARLLVEQGVLYRDMLEPNLPGVVWVHLAVRSVAGWSPIVLRLFDLLVLAGITAELLRVAGSVVQAEARGATRWLVAGGVLLFYLQTSEWCHCQRDLWMLWPCVLALRLRQRRLADDPTSAQWLPVAEGILWGCGFWLKPFVAVPALLIMADTLRDSDDRRSKLRAEALVLVGGILVGMGGILWMVRSGCWPAFLETLTEWNGSYFAAGRARWTPDRYLHHVVRFFPWIAVHLIAIPVAGSVLLRRTGTPPAPTALRLLSALYAGWLVQSFVLQQMFDYIHVPAVLLGWTLTVIMIAGPWWSVGHARPDQRRAVLLMAVCVAVLTLLRSPTLQPSVLQHWPACVTSLVTGQPLAAADRDDLSGGPFPRWTELDPLLAWCREQPQDVRFLVSSSNMIHAYPALDRRPPTRFVYLDVLARLFPQRRALMEQAVENSGARYVLCDLIEDGWSGPDPAEGELLPAAMQQRSAALCFPWNQTPRKRFGRYVVMERTGPVGPLSSEYLPLQNIRP